MTTSNLPPLFSIVQHLFSFSLREDLLFRSYASTQLLYPSHLLTFNYITLFFLEYLSTHFCLDPSLCPSMGSFRDSLFCSIDLFVYFCTKTPAMLVLVSSCSLALCFFRIFFSILHCIFLETLEKAYQPKHIHTHMQNAHIHTCTMLLEFWSWLYWIYRLSWGW